MDSNLIGATTNVLGGNEAKDYLFLNKFVAVDGVITSFRVYSAVAGNIKFALFNDNAGEPGTLVFASNAGSSVTIGENVLTLSQFLITAGTYWIGVICDTAGAISYLTTTGVTYRYKSQSYAGFSFADSPTGLSSATIYQDYVAFWGVSLHGTKAPLVMKSGKIVELQSGDSLKNNYVWYGERGVFGGGANTYTNTLDYITISTTGNATDFGDLLTGRYFLTASSNYSRGVFAGGSNGSPLNQIEYITIATTGNALDFGDLVIARYALGASSNGVRCVFIGDVGSNSMDYITIATAGNAADFGDGLSSQYGGAACSNSVRGIFGGDAVGGGGNVIIYITIAALGNASDFGDLTSGRYYCGALSDQTRGIFGGGGSDGGGTVNILDYITVATIGNATDFGDLTSKAFGWEGCSSPSRGIFSRNTSADYITVQTLGNSATFGNLSQTRQYKGSCAGN